MGLHGAARQSTFMQAPSNPHPIAPTHASRQAKRQPVRLDSVDAPLAKRFALRQLQLMRSERLRQGAAFAIAEREFAPQIAQMLGWVRLGGVGLWAAWVALSSVAPPAPPPSTHTRTPTSQLNSWCLVRDTRRQGQQPQVAGSAAEGAQQQGQQAQQAQGQQAQGQAPQPGEHMALAAKAEEHQLKAALQEAAARKVGVGS
jgi:hypothetical protein